MVSFTANVCACLCDCLCVHMTSRSQLEMGGRFEIIMVCRRKETDVALPRSPFQSEWPQTPRRLLTWTSSAHHVVNIVRDSSLLLKRLKTPRFSSLFYSPFRHRSLRRALTLTPNITARFTGGTVAQKDWTQETHTDVSVNMRLNTLWEGGKTATQQRQKHDRVQWKLLRGGFVSVWKWCHL